MTEYSYNNGAEYVRYSSDTLKHQAEGRAGSAPKKDFLPLDSIEGERVKGISRVKEKEIKKQESTEEARSYTARKNGKDWHKDYVLIGTPSQLLHIKEDGKASEISKEYLNAKHNEDCQDDRLKPYTYLEKNSLLQLADAKTYAPKKPLFFEEEGEIFFNLYDQKQKAKPAEEYTAEGLEYIKKLKAHAVHLTGNEDDAETLLQWIAWQIQREGELIRWAVLLHGFQGSGKTYISELLGTCLGHNHVQPVTNDELSGRFTSWAFGRSVNVVEEIRVKGKNRYDTLNKIKDKITNKRISIEEKNKTPYTAKNTVNYLLCTNYLDALPLDDDDRRHYVISSPYASRSEFETATGESVKKYFKYLYGGIERPEIVAQVMKFFSEMPLNKIEDNPTAPETEAKKAMILAEESNINGLEEARQIIEQDEYKKVNKKLVIKAELRELLREKSERFRNINSHELSAILTRLGYRPNTNQVKIKEKGKETQIRIWTSHKMTNNEIRQEIEGREEADESQKKIDYESKKWGTNADRLKPEARKQRHDKEWAEAVEKIKDKQANTKTPL